MKSATALLTLLSVAALSSANPLLQPRATCNADNCARAVTGTDTRTPLSTRRADCSSFLLVTVTPAPSTVTQTVTPSPVVVQTVVTVVQTAVVSDSGTTSIFVGDAPATTAAADNNKRQVNAGPTTNSPSAVPTYASACSGTARYSSACSCLGVSRSTTTATASTATTTTTLPASASTVTSTTVVTSIVTTGPATVTVTPGTRPACGSTIKGGGGCGCFYSVSCNAMYQGGAVILTRNLISEMDCLNLCDSYDNCQYADYSRTTGVCNVYSDADEVVAVNDDDAFAFAGSCTAQSSGPSCTVG